MKKLVFILILVAIGLGWWYAGKQGTTKIDVSSDTTVQRPDPSNATFVIEGNEVTFKKGKAEVDVDGTGLTQEMSITDIITYGDINNDKKDDAAFIIVTTSPISGALNSYIAAYVSGPVRYKSTDTVAIGTQVSPKSVSIKNGVVIVNYLDRKSDEPLAADPTVEKTKSFRLDQALSTLEEQ
jgi:hypothetical protein